MTLLDKLDYVDERLRAFGDSAIPFDTVIDAAAGPSEVIIDGRRTLMCGSNNYFGLSFHPDVIAAARDALERFGSATTGSRAANGTFALHRDLEREFAAFYGKQHAMVFTTGYQANLGVIAGLCGAEDVVLLDADRHASIYDGARLSEEHHRAGCRGRRIPRRGQIRADDRLPPARGRLARHEYRTDQR